MYGGRAFHRCAHGARRAHRRHRVPYSPARNAGAESGGWTGRGYNPARDLGPLFHDVQMARVFDDSKTFVDATPRAAPADIAARYLASRSA